MISINSEILTLIAIGIASIFGLQGALKLAIDHYNLDKNKFPSSCNKILLTKEAFFFKIPIAYLSVIFYVALLVQLFLIMNEEKINLYWINFEILFLVFITIYYALVMFIKLKLICLGCLRIYLANILIGISLIYYHFY